MRWNGIYHLAVLVLPCVSGIFVDDAYHIDYHEALLGLPQPHTTLFHKPQSNSNASLLYTISDKAVLGAVNPRDGSIIWRQALSGIPIENAEHAYLVAGDGDGKIATGFGHTVATWDASNGRLVWDLKLQGDSQVIGLESATLLGGGSEAAKQDLILLTKSQKQKGYVLSRLAGDGSGELWTHSDTSTSLDSTVSLATSPKHVFLISKSSGLLAGGKARVVVLDIATGKESKEYSVAMDSVGLGSARQLTVGSGSGTPFLASSESPYKTVKLNVLGNSKALSVTLDHVDEEINSLSVHHPSQPEADSYFLIHIQTASKHWAEVYQLKPSSGDAKRIYRLPATEGSGAFATSAAGSNVFFTQVTDSQTLVYNSKSQTPLGKWQRKGLNENKYPSNQPVNAVAEVVSRQANSVAVRVAVTSIDGSWYMIRNGDMQWIRPELLAYATIAAWSDEIPADPLIEELKTEVSSNPISAYIHRLSRHAQELLDLPKYLMDLPKHMFSSSSDSTTSRQKLVGSQSIIVATSRNQLVALDAANSGTVLWQSDLKTQITTETAVKYLSSHDGRVTIYLSDGSIIVANATSGSLLEHKKGTGPVSRLIELPGHPASTAIRIDGDGNPIFASDLVPSTSTEGNSILTINSKGEAIGWTVGSKIEKTWSLQPDEKSKIIDAIGRSVDEPVSSIGKVLGDRSVLYKYLSPNLALLTAVSPTTLTMYLIDAVTGSILHSTVHNGVHTKAPIPAVLSENWFAYSFSSHTTDPNTNAETLSTQLVIAELYESSIPNDRNPLASKRGNYSSFSPDSFTPPHVISQSFTIPEPISSLAVSQTAQGITSRELIAVLPDSNAIIAIPRHILDARRPISRDPTSTEAEEGLIRYNPILDLDPKSLLSHSREVIGIRKLMSTPTLLESTSLVFAFGHDVFGTQVAPSQTFDVLGKNFNRVQLILTVVALYVVLLALRPLARKSTVDRMWL